MKEFKYVVTDNEGRQDCRVQKASCTYGTWRKERP